MTLGTIIVCSVIAALGFMVWLFWTAPTGYQDADGFHLGEPPIEDWSDYTGEV
jgi:hypothetical protein